MPEVASQLGQSCDTEPLISQSVLGTSWQLGFTSVELLTCTSWSTRRAWWARVPGTTALCAGSLRGEAHGQGLLQLLQPKDDSVSNVRFPVKPLISASASSHCSGLLKARTLRWLAVPFSSGPRFVRTLHRDPSVLGGPTQYDS